MRDLSDEVDRIACEVLGHEDRAEFAFTPHYYGMAVDFPAMTFAVWKCKRCEREAPRELEGYPRESMRAILTGITDPSIGDW